MRYFDDPTTAERSLERAGQAYLDVAVAALKAGVDPLDVRAIGMRLGDAVERAIKRIEP